jgi:hypothetical protein
MFHHPTATSERIQPEISRNAALARAVSWLTFIGEVVYQRKELSSR